MEKSIKTIGMLLFICILAFSCHAQNYTVDDYIEDDMMREIMDCSMDILSDTTCFSEKMPYFKMLYDLLGEPARTNLQQKAQNLWCNLQLQNQLPMDTKKEKLNFYIKIAVYFQYFSERQGWEKYQDWVHTVIGDSLHFKFYHNGEEVQANKYILYLVVEDSTCNGRIYTPVGISESIYIPDENNCAFGKVIVKYNNLFLLVANGPLSFLSGTSFKFQFYDREKFDSIRSEYYFDKMGVSNSTAVIISEREPYFGTGTISVMKIDDLRKASSDNKKMIKTSFSKSNHTAKHAKNNWQR